MATPANPDAATAPATPPTPIPPGGRVLGIDPGLHVTGYAVIEATARGAYVVEAGVLRPRGEAARGLDARLLAIHNGVLEVLDAYPPTSLAMEQVHSHPKHPRTAILMSHARGAIMVAAARRSVPIVGYAASRIKKTLTGSGRAIKEQMQHAIMAELGLDRLPEPHDVADACAVALCHLQMGRNWQAVHDHTR